MLFDIFKLAAKLTVAFGFVLPSIETASCRYYFEHQNNTPMDWCELMVL